MKAFILRISPSGKDCVQEALESNQLIIGWADAEGLLDKGLKWMEFREIIHKKYHPDDPDFRKAGSAAGHMWRFIRDMGVGDLVVVPHSGSKFYVAEVIGSATYLPEKKDDDSAYRRPVKWLNEKKPIERKFAKSALVARMKIRGTSADATRLIDQIKDCLNIAKTGDEPTFESDLKQKLISQTLEEIRTGRMNPDEFERLIERVLLNMGAEESKVVARCKDKGADVIADFTVAGMFEQKVAVQAKYWQPDSPAGAEVVEQLIRGMKHEDTQLGMVITSGKISEEAIKKADDYYDSTGKNIVLIDGEHFAQLVLENYETKK